MGWFEPFRVSVQTVSPGKGSLSVSVRFEQRGRVPIPVSVEDNRFRPFRFLPIFIVFWDLSPKVAFFWRFGVSPGTSKH